MLTREEVVKLAMKAGFRHPVRSDGYMGTAFDYRDGNDSGASLEVFAKEVWQAALAQKESDWNRFHHVMHKHGLHPGRTDDDLIDILDKALSPRTAMQKEAHRLPDAREPIEPIGEVQLIQTGVHDEAQVRFHMYGSIPALGTKLYTTPPNHTAVLKMALEALATAQEALPPYGAIRRELDAAIAAIRATLGETK
jgi:hypothetical protein